MLWICFPLFLAELITILKIYALVFILPIHVFMLLLYMEPRVIHRIISPILLLYIHDNLLYASFCRLLLFFFFQVGIALFHFHQCIVFHCVSILLFNSHLEKHVTNNTVINILGCFPLGNMLKFLKDIHPEAIVQSSYKALTLLDTPR